jgi:hypothetical protein
MNGTQFEISKLSEFKRSEEVPFWGIDLTLRSTINSVYPNGTVYISFDEFNSSIPIQMHSVEQKTRIELTGSHTCHYLNVNIETDKNCCFTWISDKKSVLLKENCYCDLIIDLTPLTVLIEMMSLKPTRPDQKNVPIEIETIINHDTNSTAQTYNIVKTVSATQIRNIIGVSNLYQGEICETFFENKIDSIQKLLSFNCKPFFSIVDINLSHQMSYFLAILAFNKFGTCKNKLIINLDSHDDFRNCDKVTFDGWGSGFFKQCLHTQLSFPKKNNITYITLGNAEPIGKTLPLKGIAKQYYYKAIDYHESMINYLPDSTIYMLLKRSNSLALWNMKFNTSIMPQITDNKMISLIDLNFFELVTEYNDNYRLYKITRNFVDEVSADDLHLDTKTFDNFEKEFNELWNTKLWDTCTGQDLIDKRITGNLYDTDVYVSVDRDIMKRSCTYWGDGLFECYQIRSAVEKILKYLRKEKANLVGFDIVGLPEKNIHTSYPTYSTDEYIEQARDDIRIFRELVFKNS